MAGSGVVGEALEDRLNFLKVTKESLWLWRDPWQQPVWNQGSPCLSPWSVDDTMLAWLGINLLSSSIIAVL